MPVVVDVSILQMITAVLLSFKIAGMKHTSSSRTVHSQEEIAPQTNIEKTDKTMRWAAQSQNMLTYVT